MGESGGHVSIKNWERFQHYRDRDPPWVKLYRDLLTSESWVLGTDLSRVIQIASVMLAPRYGNKIPYRFDLLRKVMSLECDELMFHRALKHLVSTEFIEIHEVTEHVEQSASRALASCTSETDQIRSDQRQNQNLLSATPTTRREVSRGTADPDWWLDFKLAYPERAGDQGWRKAVRAAHARIAEGHTGTEFVSGARRYAEFCKASGKLGTEYVKQACTFLGPDKPFLLPWKPPPKPENASERILRKLNGTHDSRVIDHETDTEPIALPSY